MQNIANSKLPFTEGIRVHGDTIICPWIFIKYIKGYIYKSLVFIPFVQFIYILEVHNQIYVVDRATAITLSQILALDFRQW